MKALMKFLLTVGLIAVASIQLRAGSSAAMIVIEPAATTNVLINPGKGWSVMGNADGQPKEILEFAGMGVRRFNWLDLEPNEGEFHFEKVEQFLDSWGKLGKVCNVGVMCANTHGRDTNGYVTPKWVFDAGAKKIEIDLDPKRATTGTPGHKIAPVFDDAIFLAKFTTFIRAFAAKFDGDPRIAVYDIRSYGNWGECHMSPFKRPDIAPEKFREHVQIHLDAFKKTQLCLSCNAHLGHYGPLKPVMDWAVLEKHIAPRRDGICGNSDGRETAIGFGIAPGVFEMFGDYPFMKNLGWWDGTKDKDGMGFTLEECVENGKPTWVDLGRGGKSGMQMLNENRSLVERLSNRIGYHFHLQRVAFPRRATNGRFDLELTWTNRGVAPIYIPCAVAIALLDASGKRIAISWPAEFEPKNWLPGKSVAEKSQLTFDVPAGSYRLTLAITRKPGDAEPFIKLGTQLPVRDGWYEPGEIEIASPER